MASKYIAEELKMHFKKRVLGPEFPIVSRIRNLFHKNILLKIERENSTATAKKIISELLIAFRNKSEFKTIRIKINVDPI
jgi:primosomal protein N' (replication factor Y)